MVGGGVLHEAGPVALGLRLAGTGARGRAAHLLEDLCPEELGLALTGSLLPALPR